MRHLLVVVLLVASACKAERADVAAYDEAGARAAAPQSVAAGAADDAKTSEATTASGSTTGAVAPRMIVRNAQITVIVRDAEEALRAITTTVEGNGGYVAETRQWKEREQVRAQATFRVPAARLTETLGAIRAAGIRTESETISAQDVSQEYVDLSAQLRNLQAAETELRELLRTVRERTQRAADVVEIYTEITRIRGEIEKTEGRLQYLSQMTAMSTIRAELVPDVLAAPVVQPGWQPVATLKNALRELVSSMKLLVDALIWVVVYLLPLGLIFVALAFLVRAVWRRIRPRRSGGAVDAA